MFKNEHTNNPHARKYRHAVRVITRHAGSEDRKATAQAKRDRKNAKRVRDAGYSVSA